MKVSYRKIGGLKFISGMVVDLPSPVALSYLWGFGSLLGVFLGVQVVTGLFLVFQFSGGVEVSFNSVVHIMRDVEKGWLVRVLHANGASMFFLLMYLHIGRGFYYGSYRFSGVWLSGVSIFLLSMAAAFLGYVLPWGQMSFWAATVITNLLSAVPYVGVVMVEWVWGGFAVGGSTLTRFLGLHFILPFVILVVVMFHLIFLHETGSGSVMGFNGDVDSVVFYPVYVVSDLVGVMVVVVVYVTMCLEYPYVFMDVENFIPANSLVTPVHIQPEWYFLFAYAILRSVPSKVGGVVALVLSVLVLYLFPWMYRYRMRSLGLYWLGRVVMWVVVVNWVLLTWIGACVVEYPYVGLGSLFSLFYFGGLVFIWGVCEGLDWVE